MNCSYCKKETKYPHCVWAIWRDHNLIVKRIHASCWEKIAGEYYLDLNVFTYDICPICDEEVIDDNGYYVVVRVSATNRFHINCLENEGIDCSKNDRFVKE